MTTIGRQQEDERRRWRRAARAYHTASEEGNTRARTDGLALLSHSDVLQYHLLVHFGMLDNVAKLLK